MGDSEESKGNDKEFCWRVNLARWQPEQALEGRTGKRTSFRSVNPLVATDKSVGAGYCYIRIGNTDRSDAPFRLLARQGELGKKSDKSNRDSPRPRAEGAKWKKQTWMGASARQE